MYCLLIYLRYSMMSNFIVIKWAGALYTLFSTEHTENLSIAFDNPVHLMPNLRIFTTHIRVALVQFNGSR